MSTGMKYAQLICSIKIIKREVNGICKLGINLK